jgi:signal peptidase I
MSQTNSLVHASLEIGRVLADRDGVTFRVQGTCMYPTMRPGDVLHIQSCRAVDLTVGDIAVCRAPTYLFSHRVIDKGLKDGQAFIVTRPDRSQAGSDEPTFDDNLLGVVIAIKRKGKSAPLSSVEYPWFLQICHAARIRLIEAVPRGRYWLADSLSRMQKTTLYGGLARRWFTLRQWHVSYIVRVPLNATLADAAFRPFGLNEFDIRMTWRGKTIERWTLVLHVNNARLPAAWVSFVRSQDKNWRIQESNIRVRFRGMDFDKLLMEQAETILRRAGMSLQVSL